MDKKTTDTTTLLGIVSIPYEESVILLPDALLVAILPAGMLLPAYNSHVAVVGAFIYENVMVPVIDIAKLKNTENHSEKKQLVVVDSVTTESTVSRYAFVASAAVNRLTIAPEMIEEMPNNETLPEVFYSQITLNYVGNKQLADIIDLEKMEITLFPQN